MRINDRVASATLFLVLAVLPAAARAEQLGALVSYQKRDDGVVFRVRSEPEGKAAEVRLRLLGDSIAQVLLARPEVGPEDKSLAVVAEDWPAAPFDLKESGEEVVLSSARLSIRAQRGPFRLAFFDRSGRLLARERQSSGMAWEGSVVEQAMALAEDEHFFGLGEKTFPLDRRGAKIVNWNTDHYGYLPGSDPIYKSIPFFLSTRGYGIFFDNSYRTTFDLGSSSPEHYSFKAEGGDLNYYFIYGPSFKEILAHYTRLTGRPPLPPRWSFGLSISQWGFIQENIEEAAEGFRSRDIPLDLVILDLEWVNNFWDFKWHAKEYPDPEGMIALLKSKNLKLAMIIDPIIAPVADNYRAALRGGYFATTSEGKELLLPWPWGRRIGLVDYTNPEAAEWWFKQHIPLIEQGADGFWLDMNEPARDEKGMLFKAGPNEKIHNLYALYEVKEYYERMRAHRPNRRPWLLTRSGFSGVQRYALVWSGDSRSSYTGLSLQVQMGQSIGLSGVPFWGHDIGGFIGRSGPEVYIRWLQVGAFSPIARAHSDRCSGSRVPWSYGEEAERIARKYFKLRYRLFPYIYSYARRAAEEGLPIMRPLALEYQDDPITYTRDDQYLFGSELMVAPILDDSGRRQIYLPRGKWVDYWTGRVYLGPTLINYHAGLDTLPLFVRGGSIIPMGPEISYIGEKPLDPLTLDIYPADGEKGSFRLYEDDGESEDYMRGIFSETLFESESEGGRVSVAIGERQGRYLPGLARTIVLQVHRRRPNSVSVNGLRLQEVGDRAALDSSASGWIYDGERNLVMVKLSPEQTAQGAQVVME